MPDIELLEWRPTCRPARMFDQFKPDVLLVDLDLPAAVASN